MSELTREICRLNNITHERLAEIYLEYITSQNKSKKQRRRSKTVKKGEINDSTRAKTKSNSYV